MSDVRVRFAPSPTGALHIGGLRTALYNFLFAKSKQGKFILRIEDTDQNRLVEGAEEYIFNALDWLGITPDESTRHGGDYGPYKQSQRVAIYQEHAQRLITEGKAYYAFDTPEELQSMRDRLKAAKVSNQQYNSITRVTMRNSLTLDQQEVDDLIGKGEPHVVRLKVPSKEDVRFEDKIRGWVKVHSSTMDDKVILKSGGFPTYHLANVVDDHLMKISHVIRGEEWLPSAPLHVLLYRFFGWEESMPQFAHLPLILKPDGNGKLSKREADKHGFPIFPITWKDAGDDSMGFREKGYLPESIINFLALLGWNPGSDRELFSLMELEQTFSLDRIVKSGAKFDISKAQWFNQHYLRKKSNQELANILTTYLTKFEIEASEEKVKKAVELLKERISFPQDLWDSGKYLFVPPEQYDEQVIRKKWNEDAASFLHNYSSAIELSDQWDAEIAHKLLTQQLAQAEWGFGKVMPALRLALTGLDKGPDLMKVMEILGKQETVRRLNEALNRLTSATISKA